MGRDLEQMSGDLGRWMGAVSDIKKADAIAHLPIWIFHGALDSTVSATLSHSMLGALTDAGASPGYTQYPKTGHFSWIAAYDDEMMMDWLFSQKKK